MKRDLFTAFSIMLENKEAVALAEIEAEKINGPILIMSADKDEMIPATNMAEQLEDRLIRKNFAHKVEHVILKGKHTEPLHHFDKVYAFLDRIK